MLLKTKKIEIQKPMRLGQAESFSLFAISAYFCCYSWVLLHFYLYLQYFQ